jgi:hypothetical protein
MEDKKQPELNVFWWFVHKLVQGGTIFTWLSGIDAGWPGIPSGCT